MILDLSLSNNQLYEGLPIEVLAGRPTLTTSPDQAIPFIVANLRNFSIDPDEVVISGNMAIWVYLVVFHYIHGKTKRIFYEDGRGLKILIAAHG